MSCILQLEKDGLMNAHVEEVDGFAVIETDKHPPKGAETMVIPEPKLAPESTSPLNEKPDLNAVPSGPLSHENSLQPTKSRKAPVMP